KKEADAWELLVKAGFADEAEVARARGRNPQELKRSRIAEIKTNREEGLVFSSDAYHAARKVGMSPADAVQKAYLGVGKLITSAEARAIVNQAGGDLAIPGPEFSTEGGANAHEDE